MCSAVDLKQLHVSNRAKAHDFFKLYKTETETSHLVENIGKMDTENFSSKKKHGKQRPELNNKNEVSKVKITPNAKEKTALGKVRSIIKNNPLIPDNSTEDQNVHKSEIKRKKRIKSVSFLLDDSDETAIKKSKTNNSGISHNVNKKKRNKKDKSKHTISVKKDAEKENLTAMEVSHDPNIRNAKKKDMKRKTDDNIVTENGIQNILSPKLSDSIEKAKKKIKTNKDNMNESSIESVDSQISITVEQNIKKAKDPKQKKKKLNKDLQDITHDEKPEIIANHLKNLNIGDNAHTISDLLNEMSVANKKTKKNKGKNKRPKSSNLDSEGKTDLDLEHNEELKEKVVWKKSRWNKGNSLDTSNSQTTSLTVENIPLKLLHDYRKLLNDRFCKYGPIKYITSAELYPTEDSKPIFTTSINFLDEEAVTKALQEDNREFEGNRIRVKRVLPPTETTIVVRSYGKLTEEALSSIFVAAGRIRKIRFLVKGKKALCTGFVEFDGPEAVEKALNLAADARVAGKKIHVSKFDNRQSKEPKQQGEKV